jgi:hypothetical protein
MGSVIRKDAAVEDILADVRKTMSTAQAKGAIRIHHLPSR